MVGNRGTPAAEGNSPHERTPVREVGPHFHDLVALRRQHGELISGGVREEQVAERVAVQWLGRIDRQQLDAEIAVQRTGVERHRVSSIQRTMRSQSSVRFAAMLALWNAPGWT